MPLAEREYMRDPARPGEIRVKRRRRFLSKRERRVIASVIVLTCVVLFSHNVFAWVLCALVCFAMIERAGSRP